MAGEAEAYEREVEKEQRWLAHRPKMQLGITLNVPSCLALYGCVGTRPLPVAVLSRPYIDESDHRTAAEILGRGERTLENQEDRRLPRRRKRKLVTYRPPIPAFGDPVGGEAVKLVGQTYHSLTGLIAQQTRDLDSLKSLLGLPEPCQPFYFHGSFFVPRCKAWQCTEHQSVKPALATPEERAFASIAWSKAEPLSTPPICSCRDSTRVRKWVNALLRAVELSKTEPPDTISDPPGAVSATDPLSIHSPTIQSPVLAETPAGAEVVSAVPATPSGAEVKLSPNTDAVAGPLTPAEELDMLEKTLLFEASNCKSCGGLCYFPFSFIEVFLHSHMPNLNEFQANFPDLPPNTDVCCDGPHISATICCKSAKHEWAVFQALFRKQLVQAPIIYDVCSQCFIPGVPTRPGQKRLHEREVPVRVEANETKLRPPAQRFLNCAKVVPLPTEHFTITSLAARRPYCLTVRPNVDVMALGRELQAAQPAPPTPANGELVSALHEYGELRKKLRQLDRDIESLQLECLANEVCTPWHANDALRDP